VPTEASPTPTAAASRVSTLRAEVNAALQTLVPDEAPALLYAPARYVLDGQGKRVRPVLLLLAAEAFGTAPATAMPAALAVELFHNFTLVHDDIMDHAEARRGRPTVHCEWDPETAILTGDYLMGQSYRLLSQVDSNRLPALLDVYHTMVERLCKGQALDKTFETQRNVSVDAYLRMIDCKTGALLEAVLELGGIIGGASADQRTALRTLGRAMGRAFQIQDDLLDVTADSEQWGKVVGGDLVEGKKTFLLLRALERADGEDYAWFNRILDHDGLPERQIDEARARMDRLGVFDEARDAVRHHSSAARDQLARLPQNAATHTLQWFIDELESRVH
jgi:geranylgeranyl diphosphate synthase, type II